MDLRDKLRSRGVQRWGQVHRFSKSIGKFENDAQLLEFVVCHIVTESVLRNKRLLPRHSLL